MVTSTLVEVVWCCCCCCCCRRRSRRRARASSLERSREKSSHRYHRFIGRRGHPWFRGPRSHASREGRPHFQFVLCRIILFFYSWRFVPKNKRDYSFCVTDCLYYELCPKHSILRPNNALFLCFFRIKNFYSCVLVTDYSIIKRNHHHHHRQNVTPAYRRDTTRSKPAIGAIETKEYLPSIARETERERERQRETE